MHVLPRVREIEQRFPDALTVIGVHAGKYTTERRTDRIAAAADRLGVHHAVVNDRHFRIWREYAVQAWPTIALVDTRGHMVGVQPGEFPVEPIATLVGDLVAEAERRGNLVRGSDPILQLQPSQRGPTLRYPGRITIAGDRLLVADTGNGRVLDARLDESGVRAEVVAEHTGFAEPYGMVAVGGYVYVADRADHSIWRVGSDGQRVRVAGTGTIADGMLSEGPASGPLRSPWGLADDTRGGLLVAMAGAHQLWRLTPGSETIELVAGRGGEDIADGPARHALLAQPTGVSTDGSGHAAIADCESSAVRMLDDKDAPRLSTLVGTGLFDFGDRDGVGDDALLQHDQDVAWHAGAIAVADTYNDRLKRVVPQTRRIEAWQGRAGEPGGLREPGGVASDGRRLFVADTGHHRVVVVGADGTLEEVVFA